MEPCECREKINAISSSRDSKRQITECRQRIYIHFIFKIVFLNSLTYFLGHALGTSITLFPTFLVIFVLLLFVLIMEPHLSQLLAPLHVVSQMKDYILSCVGYMCD